MKLSLKTNSSQRWAIGAVSLALLFACSPKAPEAPEPAKPLPESGPQLSAPPNPINANPAVVPPDATPPGYADDWAAIEADCADPAKTYKLSATTLDMTPDKRTCSVKSIGEEHPTGRSMIYTLDADCSAAGQATKDVVKFNFGASDTVMQFALNDREPVRLVRCP
jgi:hypothetical protein